MLHLSLWAGGIFATATLGLAGYGFIEASFIRIREQTIIVPRLPTAFQNIRIVVLADFHHGPLVGLSFIRRAVTLAQALEADVFALVGDFAHKGSHTREQLPPCLEVLSQLEAPLGVYTVPGNHDMQDFGQVYHEEIQKTPLTDLTNRAVPLRRDNQTLWIAGVDDLWWGTPDLQEALAIVPADEPVVLLSHNPDFAEDHPDERVDLILSGHTHGGQAHFPWIGSPWIPSKYGNKYRHGLVQGPASQVFISRGLGESSMPLRVNSPPEINVLTLRNQ